MIIKRDTYAIYTTEESSGYDICIKDESDGYILIYKDYLEDLLADIVFLLSSPERHCSVKTKFEDIS
jgi:hypothetical protein